MLSGLFGLLLKSMVTEHTAPHRPPWSSLSFLRPWSAGPLHLRRESLAPLLCRGSFSSIRASLRGAPPSPAGTPSILGARPSSVFASFSGAHNGIRGSGGRICAVRSTGSSPPPASGRGRAVPLRTHLFFLCLQVCEVVPVRRHLPLLRRAPLPKR